MRIIAGQRRGLILSTFDDAGIRPTKDIVKEFIFNCLANITDMSASTVCDLFAGTGNLGIEALSRGACRATFIENDPRAAALILRNLKKAKLEKAYVIQADAVRFLETPSQEKFDIVFADPPYSTALGNFIIDNVMANGYLSPHGVLVVETSPDEILKPPDAWPGLKFYKQKKWGTSRVTILQNIV
jgi:16S rRNA (guanine966-N2)-methyltransferase